MEIATPTFSASFAETRMWRPLMPRHPTLEPVHPANGRHQRLRSQPNSRLIPALYSSSLDPAILTISSSVLPAHHFISGTASGPTG